MSVATVTMLSLRSGRGELELPSVSRRASWAESGGWVTCSRAVAGRDHSSATGQEVGQLFQVHGFPLRNGRSALCVECE